MIRRRNSAEKVGHFSTAERRSSRDSSTSIESAEARPRFTDTKFPKHLVEHRGKRSRPQRSLADSYMLRYYIEEEDEEPSQNHPVKRFPRIKIFSDFREFSTGSSSFVSSRSIHEESRCISDDALSRVDEDAALEEDEVKIRKEKCKLMRDKNEFNTSTPRFEESSHLRELPEDIAEVLEVDDKEVAKTSGHRLRVDELDGEPKKVMVESFALIEEEKNDDEVQPRSMMHSSESAFIRKIILSQSQIISEEDEARQTFERQQCHQSSCEEISEDLNEESVTEQN